MANLPTTAQVGTLQALIDSPQHLVIFALDREYRYLAFNELHRQTMKAIWNVEIYIGQSMLTDVVGREDDRVKAKVAFDRALGGERFVTVEAYGDDKLSRRIYENAWAPIFAAPGQVVGLTCYLSDVTAKLNSDSEREQLRTDVARQNEQLAQGMKDNAQLVDRLRLAVSELSTPVLELWDSVLALPVVGIVDTERGGQMSLRLLEAVERQRAQFVIIDLTGVNMLDTSTANRFLQIARAVALLGAECIIAGIQATIAQTLVALGVDLGGLKTTRNLKQALELCIAQRNAHRDTQHRMHR
jgi:rsbT co-antagonist protein RsbR